MKEVEELKRQRDEAYKAYIALQHQLNERVHGGVIGKTYGWWTITKVGN